MGHWSNAGTEAFKRHGSLVKCLLSPIVKNSIPIFTVCVGKVLQDFCFVSSLLWDFLVDTTHDLPVLRFFFYCERDVQEFLLRGVNDFVNILVRMLKQYRYQLAPSILGPSVFLIWKNWLRKLIKCVDRVPVPIELPVIQCCGADIFIFYSGSTFVHNFDSGSNSCHILPLKSVL